MRNLILLSLVLLCGCAHNLQLVSRSNSGNGTGVAQEAGKQITINLNGQTYTGTYVYDGTKVLFTTGDAYATAYSGNSSASAYGHSNSTTYIPGSGKGQLVATSGNDTIRCDFNYSDGSGIGYCQDNSHNEYDLIIH